MLEDNKKQMIKNSTMHLYFACKKEIEKDPEGHEMPDWLTKNWNNKQFLLDIIDRGEKISKISDKVNSKDYPNFWNDLWEEVQSLKIDTKYR